MLADLHGVLKCAEAFDLDTECQVTQLRVSKEDDEEHDGETGNILGTMSECFTQLGHCLVETDVLEHLQ